MHLAPLIRDLALILGIAGIVTFIFRKIHQPVVLGYLIAGIIIGPHTPPFPLVTDLPNIQVLAELGVIFLMFSLGLEFSFHKLMRVGGSASVTALVEVIGMLAIGYGAGMLLGWNAIDSIFLGGILSVSSTTIIIKAFDELNLKTRRFAQLVFGVLIVEDLVAILLLVALSTMATTQSLFSFALAVSGVKLILIVASWFLVGYLLIPSLLRYASRWMDNETITVTSVGLCLLLVVFATNFGYSAALGAFIMGSILSETDESSRIETLIHPLRDIFAAVFFVSVGMLVDPKVIVEKAGPVALITFLTIAGKLLTSTLGALLTGQPLKRSVMVGFSLAQIGEFSFIIATLGASLKVTSDFLYPIAVTVSVITTFTTPYLIRYSTKGAELIEKALPHKMRLLLERYSARAQEARPADQSREMLLKRVGRLLLNGIIVTVIFLSVAEIGIPWLAARFPDSSSIYVLSWLVALLISAPFVWGMLFSFRIEGESLTGAYFFTQFFTILWVALLGAPFFNTFTSFLILSVGCLVLLVLFYRRLELSYRWFEEKLVSNIKEKEGGKRAEEALYTLAPWELQLVRIKVDPNCKLTGKTLKESEIRTRLGLNIVVIQRGQNTMASPEAEERILPGDDLLVLGTDEQIDELRKEVELPAQANLTRGNLSSYALRRHLVKEKSPLDGQTIRGSGLRQSLQGLVVGLEREDFRTMNPDPSTTLQPGDVLWVMGEARK